MTEPTCPTPCDRDCEQLCHEVHEVEWKRDHRPEDCPAQSHPAALGQDAGWIR
jgi:hypothetical protein